MTHVTPHPDTLPTTRPNHFDPPPRLLHWARQTPIRPLTYADGHRGWLATDPAVIRAVLTHPHFSNRPEHLHLPVDPYSTRRRRQHRPGFFLQADPPEHTRYRRRLIGHFTVRRMKALRPRIEAITAGHLDAMCQHGPPVDLVPAYALPIPSLVICELLGVPYTDRARFQRDSRTLLSLASTPQEADAALDDLTAYLRDLTRHKHAHPADDLITDMTRDAGLTDEEITNISVLLLVAGHETTANMIALGVFALLANPVQLAAVRDDPAATHTAVEELLRYLTIVHLGPVRAAIRDTDIGGHHIAAGQCVTLALAAANRDPRHHPDPDALDVTRPPTGHLAFGHGIHQCLGQHLARTELAVAYPALLRRLPALRLAVPPRSIPIRAHTAIYGVDHLPVTWEETAG
ncbi:cytochrome P450 [Streptosporangium sandarakinum]|uniref:cytochrome P450 n=1 Tax=Streptosporangium sandarakinum TaxID=1260955 RepID=UPI003448871A